MPEIRPTSRRWPLCLLAIYIVEFILLAINPYSRVIWITENSISLMIVTALIVLFYRGVRFSNTAYTLMALYLCFHTVGGHYTFERVPFDIVTDFFGFERNHFDRVCHFMVGFFAYPAVEYFESRQLIRGRGLNIFLMIMAIFGVAGLFELVEWIYAELAAPEAGNAFLGSQGDIWDAQKDMLSDGLGAIFSTSLYAVIKCCKKGCQG
jgi:putative membrane protein